MYQSADSRHPPLPLMVHLLLNSRSKRTWIDTARLRASRDRSPLFEGQSALFTDGCCTMQDDIWAGFVTLTITVGNRMGGTSFDL